MQLDPLDGRGPLYRQVYRVLRQAILEGRLAAGVRLPSTRWLAAETGVARNRCVLAYGQLHDEGYVTGRVGSGTYVAAEVPSTERARLGSPPAIGESRRRRPPRLAPATRPLLARGAGWTATSPRLRWDFHVGRPVFRDFPRSVWARLVRRRAMLAAPAELDYAPSAGLPDLRAAIAVHLTRWRGVACTPERVIVTNGSQQALGLVASFLVEPGGTVAIEDPHYAGARQAFEAARAAVVPVRVDAQGLDVARLADVRPAPRLAYVTPAHQFPTGAVLPLARRLALLAWAERHDAYVVEDDYDSEYRYAGTPIETLHGLDGGGRVFYVGSFSKILSPALRLGFLVVPPALERAFAIAKTAADLGSASFGQRVLADFITAGHLEAHLRRARRRHAVRRAALLAAVAEHIEERVEVRGGAAGLHVMLVFRDRLHADVPDIIARARHAGVGVYATRALYLGRPRRAELLLGHGALEGDEICAGITRLGTVLRAR